MSNGFLGVAAIGALFVIAGCGGGSTSSPAAAPAATAGELVDTAGVGATPLQATHNRSTCPELATRAAIVQNTGLLVLKGDTLAVISISGGANLSEAESIEVAKQIGSIAAGRM